MADLRGGQMSELRRYLRHFTPSWPGFALAAVLMAVAAAVPGAAVLLLRETLDDVLVAGDASRLGLLAGAFAGLYLLDGVLRVARTRITKGIAWRVTSGLRRELHRHYLRQSPSQQAGTGERIARLTHEVDELQYGVSALVTAFRNPLTLVGLGVTALWLAPALAPWALLLVPAVYLPTRWGGHRLRVLAGRQRDARSGLAALLGEQLTGLRTIQSFAAEVGEAARFVHAEERDRRARLRLEVERVLPSAAVAAVAAVAVGLFLWFGGLQVLDGRLEAGQLVGFAVALGLMNRPLSGLSEVWGLLQRSLAALEKVYSTLDTSPEVVDPQEPVALGAGTLVVRWEGVWVDYGSGPVLSGVDLEARPGEILAVVGPSGAGKSTLLGLVERVRDPDAGRVTLGGVDAAEVALPVLRGAVAVVRQEDFLFSRTIGENLRLGSPRATDVEARHALERAGAGFALDRLDDTLAEAGANLSSGERQRLCLARALLTDAPVLVLDEATNQVDAETQRDILAALEGLKVHRTVLLVAHDLTAVRGADRLAILEDGVVSEEGSWEDLAAAGGSLARLVRAREGARAPRGEAPQT